MILLNKRFFCKAVIKQTIEKIGLQEFIKSKKSDRITSCLLENYFKDEICQNQYNTIQKQKNKISLQLLEQPINSNKVPHIGNFYNQVLKDIYLRFCSSINIKVKKQFMFFQGNSTYKDENIKVILDYYKRWGILGDYTNILFVEEQNIQNQLNLFITKALQKKALRKELQILFWCKSSQKAIQEEQIIEKLEIQSTYLYKIQVTSSKDKTLRNAYLIVEVDDLRTIPFIQGISIDQQKNYLIVQLEEETIIIEEQIFNKYANIFRQNEYVILSYRLGEYLLKQLILFKIKKSEQNFRIYHQKNSDITLLIPEINPQHIEFCYQNKIKFQSRISNNGIIEGDIDDFKNLDYFNCYEDLKFILNEQLINTNEPCQIYKHFYQGREVFLKFFNLLFLRFDNKTYSGIIGKIEKIFQEENQSFESLPNLLKNKAPKICLTTISKEGVSLNSQLLQEFEILEDEKFDPLLIQALFSLNQSSKKSKNVIIEGKNKYDNFIYYLTLVNSFFNKYQLDKVLMNTLIKESQGNDSVKISSDNVNFDINETIEGQNKLIENDKYGLGADTLRLWACSLDNKKADFINLEPVDLSQIANKTIKEQN